MRYRIERLTFGGILDQAFRLLRDHFVPMTATFAVLYVPMYVIGDIVQRVGLTQGPSGVTAATTLLGGLGGLAVLVLLPLAQLVLTSVILDAYLGRPVSIRAALARTRPSYAGYVGTSFLMCLAAIPLVMLFVVPGIYFMVCWMLVGPVAVMEVTLGRAAMKRSRALVRGYFWRTFGIVLVAFGLGSLVGGGIESVFNFIPVLGAALTGVVQSMTGAYGAAALVVLYIDLRCRHENFDLQLLATQIAAQDSNRPPPVARARPSQAPVA